MERNAEAITAKILMPKEAVRFSKGFVCVTIAHADDHGVNQLF